MAAKTDQIGYHVEIFLEVGLFWLGDFALPFEEALCAVANLGLARTAWLVASVWPPSNLAICGSLCSMFDGEARRNADESPDLVIIISKELNVSNTSTKHPSDTEI